jgi:hypothetical protein
MNRTLLIISLVFAVTVAVVFGFRASSDAIAVIIGVILGVAASVPTTVILTYTLLRTRSGTSGQPPASHNQPSIVVINPADKPGVSQPLSWPSVPAPSAQERKWTLIGDDPTD